MRHRRLAVAEQHPDLHVVERTGAAIPIEAAREIVRRASLSPAEGDRKVMVLDEFHLVSPAAAATLLKTIEEPPPGTYFVVLADEVTPDLVTIASRCVRVDFPPLLGRHRAATRSWPRAPTRAGPPRRPPPPTARSTGRGCSSPTTGSRCGCGSGARSRAGSTAPATASPRWSTRSAPGSTTRRRRSPRRRPARWPRSTSGSSGTASGGRASATSRPATGGRSAACAPTSCGSASRSWPTATGPSSRPTRRSRGARRGPPGAPAGHRGAHPQPLRGAAPAVAAAAAAAARLSPRSVGRPAVVQEGAEPVGVDRRGEQVALRQVAVEVAEDLELLLVLDPLGRRRQPQGVGDPDRPRWRSCPGRRRTGGRRVRGPSRTTGRS